MYITIVFGERIEYVTCRIHARVSMSITRKLYDQHVANEKIQQINTYGPKLF